MKISTVFPRRYASGADLKGQAYTLTVARVVMEEMHSQAGAPAEKKPVMYMQETQRGIILSPALGRQLAALLGDETDTWTGKRVTLYPQPMRVAGQDRIAIRAQAATNGPSQPPASLQEEEEE